MLQLAVKFNLSFGKSLLEGILNFPAKNFPERPFWQKKTIARICRNPALMIERQTAGRNYTVHMWMVLQLLRPGMEHTEEADIRSKEFGIAGDLNQGFATEAQKHCVDEPLVLQCKLRQKRRHSKDNMSVRNGKKLFLPPMNPTTTGVGLTFRTVPIAT